MEEIEQLNRKTINRVLIANRGEIVTRIMRTCESMGIETVVIYTADDLGRPYVRQAQQSVLLEGETLDQTYLNQNRIIDIARAYQVDALHPGYGFLSENASFAQKCIDHDIIWIGPSPSIMRRMADKTQARSLAENIEIPVIPAFTSSRQDPLQTLKDTDFPILLKAAAGGGGRGMRVVRNKKDLKDQLRLAADEARLAFGDDRLFIEKYIEKAKHIEVQILGDQHGNYIHLFERECTIQRRYQKIIEESPSPSISDKIRNKLTKSAIELARASEYNNAGTVEFLVTPEGEFYFIETNARIQVEHPVTEMITGVDLIEQQIRIARGEVLKLKQDDIQVKGHALECRICAESPQNDFSPFPGTISHFILPEGKGIRVDSALFNGSEISPNYDSLIAKLIVHAENRENSVMKANQFLRESAFLGIETNIPYLMEILDHPDFQSGEFFTSFISINHKELINNLFKKRSNGYTNLVLGAYGFLQTARHKVAKRSGNPWKDLGYWRAVSEVKVEVDDQLHIFEMEQPEEKQLKIRTSDNQFNFVLASSNQQHLTLSSGRKKHKILWHLENNQYSMSVEGNLFILSNPLAKSAMAGSNGLASGQQVLKAPLPGKLSRVNFEAGDIVKSGETMAIIESMKVENQILSPCDGQVISVEVSAGVQVKMKQVLIIIEPK